MKKKEIKKENLQKKINIADRIKMMEGKNILFKQPPEAMRRNSANINFNFNQMGLGAKKEEKKEEKDKKVENKPSNDFTNKLNKMQMMFANRGGFKPRPSAQFTGLPKLDNLDNNNKNKKLEIISEKPDVLKEGFNPVDELEKNLNKIVVQKDKKKRRKTIFEEE